MGNKFSHLESKSTQLRNSIFLDCHSQYWIWCPIMGPILGALFGAFVYDAVLYAGEENIFTQSFVIFLSIALLLYLP